MTPNSASHLSLVEEEEDYSKFENTIYMLHCIKTNTTDVNIITILDAKFVTFPAGSFVAGALYPIYLKKLKKGSDVQFIAYHYDRTPFTK